jgi:phosphoglycerate dehydrogenase-like enzyme
VTDIFIPDLEAVDRMNLPGYVAATTGIRPRAGHAFTASAEEIRASIGDAEILGLALGRADTSVFEAAPKLRLVVKCGIGTDSIDLDAARSAGVQVVRTAGVNFRGVAEFVIGSAISHLRRFSALDAAVRRGEWATLRSELAGRLDSLYGRTLGVVGFGVIGSEVGRLAQAHGMHVLVHDPWVPASVVHATGATPAGLSELLENADVVSLHVLLNESTRHLIDRGEFQKMKSSALLVNTSRGPVVKEEALVEALKSGQIAGAALDVFEIEPPPAESGLRGLENCLLSPHVAGCTASGYHEIGQLAAELMRAFLAGDEFPKNCVVV